MSWGDLRDFGLASTITLGVPKRPMISIAWIGTAGIVAIEGSYVPQIVRLFRLKRAEELSLFFPALNFFGRLLALTYSLLRADSVFTFGFTFGALLRLTLLLEVAWYRRFPGGRPGFPAGG